MQLDTKVRIAKVSLSTLTAVVALILLGLLVIVLSAGLEINPFRETTTSLLLAAFAGLIGLAVVLVLLNVAVNISLIADARISELRTEPKRGWAKQWLIGYFAIAVVLVGIVVGGTWLSKNRYLNVVEAQADEVLRNNRNLLEEMSRLLASGNVKDYKRIVEIHDFLENQRSGLPRLTLIYPGKFADKLAFYQINGYFPYDRQTNTYTPLYFPCTQNIDCDYLGKFFSGGNVEVLRKYTIRDDQFYIYIPFSGKESRFVLLFDRTNRYGKLGS
jgi:hypothetical protein